MNQKIINFILGTPGSGKTTMLEVAKKYFQMSGRKIFYGNLDPGIHLKLEKTDLDIRELISLPEISTELHLGPNGAIIFIIEFLDKNLDWFEAKIEKLSLLENPFHLCIDFPGQIELYTHHPSLKNLVKRLKKNHLEVKGVFLTDFFLSKDTTVNHGIFLNSLLVIFNLEISCIHLLTKTDLFKNFDLVNNHLLIFEESVNLSRTYSFKKKFNWSLRILRKIKEMVFDFSPLKVYPVSMIKPIVLKGILEKLEDLD
mmetsp:Transcript_25992/g.52133  ORF Transcript_25992/g.52133 Transcript_25992/m.52133 type:complete len:256 (+) Transcript_25992:126-893(+)